MNDFNQIFGCLHVLDKTANVMYSVNRDSVRLELNPKNVHFIAYENSGQVQLQSIAQECFHDLNANQKLVSDGKAKWLVYEKRLEEKASLKLSSKLPKSKKCLLGILIGNMTEVERYAQSLDDYMFHNVYCISKHNNLNDLSADVEIIHGIHDDKFTNNQNTDTLIHMIKREMLIPKTHDLVQVQIKATYSID